MPFRFTLFQHGKSYLHILAILVCLLSSAGPVSAADYYYQFSDTAVKAYKAAISLRFKEANGLLQQMQANEPDNLMRLYIENYIDFLTVFLNEDKEEYKVLLKKAEKRFLQLAKGDNRSAYFLYTQAEARLQWAIARGKFGDYLSAINEVKMAYALLEENQRRHPEFIANQKSLGIIHAMVGNVPDEYKWAIKMFGGMTGTIEKGLSEVEEVIVYAKKHYFIFEEESIVSYSFLVLHIGNNQDRAWDLINNKKLNPKENPLAGFALANVAMRTGRNDVAIQTLQDMPSGGAYYPFHFKNFMLGVAKLSRQDQDAHVYLEKFIQHKGVFYVKEAWQKLAWYHLLQGNPAKYKECISKCLTEGSDRFEPDKAAEREAKSGEMPDELLLKGRILFDGGYLDRAYQTLNGHENDYQVGSKEHLEYTYRMGRITHQSGKTDQAVQFYQKTVQVGRNKPWYFACNASLQLGLLYEKKRDFANAKAAFRDCLNIHPSEYEASLHAKAKVGLNRVGG